MVRSGGIRFLGLAAVLCLAWLAAVGCGDGDGDGDGDAVGDGEDFGTVELGDLEISGAYARAGVDPSALYFTVKNNGDEDDALTGVSVDVAGMATLHQTVMEGGSMSMEAVDRIEVPANGEAVLEPGGYHVMLMELERTLEEGDKINVELTFEKAGIAGFVAKASSFEE